MKLKCKKDHTDASNGVFGIGAHPPEKISGLTKGKEYAGQAIALVWTVTEGVRIDQDDYKFLIYNDLGKWETYDPNLFEPA